MSALEFLIWFILAYFGINMLLFIYAIGMTYLTYRFKGEEGIKKLKRRRSYENWTSYKIVWRVFTVAYYPMFWLAHKIEYLYNEGVFND